MINKKNQKRGEILFVVILFLLVVFSMAFFLTKKNLENQKNTLAIEAALINSNKNENSTQSLLSDNQGNLGDPLLGFSPELASNPKDEVFGLVRKQLRKDVFVTFYLQDYDVNSNSFLGNTQIPKSLCLSRDGAIELKFFYQENGEHKTENLVFSSDKQRVNNAPLLDTALDDCRGFEKQISFRLPQRDYTLLTLRSLEDEELSVKLNFANNLKAPAQGEVISVTNSTDNITQNKRTFRFYPQALIQGLLIRY